MSSSAAPIEPASPLASLGAGGGSLPDWAPYAAVGGGGAAAAMILAATSAFAWGLFMIATGILSTAGIYSWSRAVENRREAKNRLMTFVIVFAFLLALTPLVSLLYEVVHRGTARFDAEF